MAVHRAHETRDGSAGADDAWSEAAASLHAALRAFYAPYDEVSRVSERAEPRRSRRRPGWLSPGGSSNLV